MEEPPELYAIDGAVPAEALEARVEWLRRNPSHPGHHIAVSCELKSVSVAEAAAQFGIECADLTAVIEERSPVTPDLALRLEEAGWSPAERWLGMQTAYDLAQARRRRGMHGRVPTPQARATEPAAAAS